MSHPLITPAQAELEALALGLLDQPGVADILARRRDYWLDSVTPSSEMLARFDPAFEQAAFCAALLLINSDPNHPQILCFGRPRHRLDGRDVPGTRAGHPVPDYYYRFVPINGSAEYRLTGRMHRKMPTAFEIGLLTKEGAYLAALSLADIQFDSDGGFVLSIGPSEGSGTRNHLRSNPSAHQLIIRDIVGDPAIDRPFHLTVERLGTTPAAPKVMIDWVADYDAALKRYIDDLLGVTALMKTPPNTFSSPTLNSGGQHLVTQAYSSGWVQLADDESLIVDLTLGGASYAVVPVTDVWGGIGDFPIQRSAIGTSQADACDDGSYRFAISAHDPGVANWVDTGGLRESVVLLRWVGFNGQSELPPPTLSTRVIKLGEVAQAFPAAQHLEQAHRARQMGEKLSAYTAIWGN